MTLFFDLEFYVPPKLRDESRVKLTYNPTQEENIILGGVFTSSEGEYPKQDSYTSIWVWEEENFRNNLLSAEKAVLQEIYNYFKDLFNSRGEQSNTKIALNTVGFGIARVDLQALFIRSELHQLAPTKELFEIYLGGFPLDLNNAAIGFLPQQKEFRMEPKPASWILGEFGIEQRKSYGGSVWDHFDNKEYEAIHSRTTEEVRNIIDVYFRMKNRMRTAVR